VIVHGGHAEDDVAEGFGRWARTVEDLSCEVPVLIENTAGGKNAVARRMDDFALLWDRVKDVKPKITLGICIDTCHAHSAGEDLSDVIERVIGFAGRSTCCTRTTRRTPRRTRPSLHTGNRRDRRRCVASHDQGGERAGHLREQAAAARRRHADMDFVREALA